MNVRVDPNRFLSVACEPDERIVFDRQEAKYHLLRDSAARLWDEICEGGTFEIAAGPSEGQDPVALLAEAGLVGIADDASDGITRRVWLRRTGKVSAAAFVLPLVASISAPRLVLGQVDASVEEQLEPTGSNEPLQETQSLSQSSTGTSSSDKLSREQRRELKGGNGVGNGSPQTFQSSGSPGNSDGENGTRTRRRTGQGLTNTQTSTQSGPSSTGLIRRRDRDR